VKYLLIILLFAACTIDKDLQVQRVRVVCVERLEVMRYGRLFTVLVWEDQGKVKYMEFNTESKDSVGTVRTFLMR
jgi:hypothetical protein